MATSKEEKAKKEAEKKAKKETEKAKKEAEKKAKAEQKAKEKKVKALNKELKDLSKKPSSALVREQQGKIQAQLVALNLPSKDLEALKKIQEKHAVGQQQVASTGKGGSTFTNQTKGSQKEGWGR